MTSRTKTVTTGKAPGAQNKKITRKKPAPRKSAARKASTKNVSRKPDSTPTIKLETVSDINNAESIHRELGRIKTNSDINIDASAVEMIDTAVLQLLFAFVIKVQSSSHMVNWIKPSPEFIGRAKLLGLSRDMGIS